MPKFRTHDKDTTIKDKPQPIDLADDAADADELADEVLLANAVNVDTDEESLLAPRPDADKAI